MESGLAVPASDEKDYCHFCFGASNLHLVFPLVRPDLQSIIDNIIGITIAPEAHETFSLCKECINTMDMFITFRNKSRSHYEKVREVKIMNQAVKKMFPIMRDNINQSAPFGSSAANEMNKSNSNDGVNSNVALVETTPNNRCPQAENNYCNGSALKTIFYSARTQQKLDFDCESPAKKARIQNGTNHKTKYYHIREIMNRFRNRRLQDNDARNGSESSPISCMQNRTTLLNDNTSDKFLNNNSSNQLLNDNSSDQLLNDNSSDKLLNVNTFEHQAISCKPCVVVVQKFPVRQTDLCKS